MSPDISKLNVRQLQIVIDALEEIDAHFYMVGFSTEADEATVAEAQTGEESVEAPELDAEEEDDSYSDSEADGMYDREDIEIAIDAFLSELHRAKLIKKNKKGKLPSFSEVFETLFGDVDITGRAREFEEFVKGYFGFVLYEAMCSAREQFVKIQSIAKSELEIAKRR